ncbi:MAG: metal-dependent hydrolase [Pseudomonadota bacterium]
MHADSLSKTPRDVAIEPRDVRFELGAHLGGNWCAGDAFRTDFANALSLSFPRGEKFFVDSVRHFLPQLKDEQLIKDVRHFVQQESMHRREHERYNRALCDARGYIKDDIESIYVTRIEQSSTLPPMVQLAITVCLEHFTALFAHGVLTDARWLEGVDPELAALWQWHALEETEHKSVAFDVYEAVGGSRRMLRTTMRVVLIRFFKNTLRTMRKMQRAEGRPMEPLAYWFKGLRFLFGKRGLLTQQKHLFAAFFRDDFHPWEHDNRELIVATTERLAL